MNSISFDKFENVFIENANPSKKKVNKIVRFLIKADIDKSKEGRFLVKVWDNMYSRIVFKASISKKKLKSRFEDTIKCYKTACTSDYTVKIINEDLVYENKEEKIQEG